MVFLRMQVRLSDAFQYTKSRFRFFIHVYFRLAQFIGHGIVLLASGKGKCQKKDEEDM